MGDKTCKKLSGVLVGAHIEIDPPRWVGCTQWKDPAAYALALRDWAKDLEDFIRDHRSQDACGVEVVRETQDLCSCCKGEWETYVDDVDGSLRCATCGALVEG